MRTVKKDGQEFEIDCNEKYCGSCSYKPTFFTEEKCKLFDVLIDRLNDGTGNDGLTRVPECINAEIR